MSVARTGLPHTSHTAPAPQPAPNTPGVALDRTPSDNGYRTPAAVAPAALEDRTDAEQYGATAPDARSRVRALVARERAAARP